MTSKDYLFYLIPAILIDNIWEEIVPHLQRVIDASAGEITLESTYIKVRSGASTIIAVYKGTEIVAVNMAEVNVYESGLRALLIPVVGGNEAFEWGPGFLAFCNDLAKKLGCTEMRGFSTRESWKRVLKDYGWVESHFVIKCNVG